MSGVYNKIQTNKQITIDNLQKLKEKLKETQDKDNSSWSLSDSLELQCAVGKIRLPVDQYILIPEYPGRSLLLRIVQR